MRDSTVHVTLAVLTLHLLYSIVFGVVFLGSRAGLEFEVFSTAQDTGRRKLFLQSLCLRLHGELAAGQIRPAQVGGDERVVSPVHTSHIGI